VFPFPDQVRNQKMKSDVCVSSPVSGTSPRGGLADWRVQRVAAFIEANIGNNFRVRDLARVASLSSGHFQRAFKQSFGESPHGYISRQRVRYAQAIMLGSRDSLAKIAIDCGMADQSHFSRVFRRVVGVNPAAWRREFSTDCLIRLTSRGPDG
jgi:transcriptional regulator GlxA family with amidase domain